jgi:hypothetical protein
MIYSDRERDGYLPPPCPFCGSTDTTVEWVHVPDADTNQSDPDAPQWAPGTFDCNDCHGRPEEA